MTSVVGSPFDKPSQGTVRIIIGVTEPPLSRGAVAVAIATCQLSSGVARPGLQGQSLACYLRASSVGGCNKGAKWTCSVSSAGGVLGCIMLLVLDKATLQMAHIIVHSVEQRLGILGLPAFPWTRLLWPL